MTTEPVQLEVHEQRARAIQHSAWSLIVPGLGQLVQRRYGTAVVQFGTVAAYVIGMFGLGGRRALFLVLFWTLWSVVDAYRHDVDERL